MTPQDFLEELIFLRTMDRLHEDQRREMAAYLKQIADGIERGLPPNKRLSTGEAALEAALALLRVYRKAHPDEQLEQMGQRVDAMVDVWREAQTTRLIG